MAERTIEQMRAERDLLAHAFALHCESRPVEARKIMARVEAIEVELTACTEKAERE